MKDNELSHINLKSADMMTEVRALNERAYELFGRLKEYDSFLQSEDYLKAIAKNIFEAYLQEYEILALQYKWLYEREKYKLVVENAGMIPKRKRRWYWLFSTKPNTAAKLIEDKASLDFTRVFATQQSDINGLYATLYPEEDGDTDKPEEPAAEQPAPKHGKKAEQRAAKREEVTDTAQSAELEERLKKRKRKRGKNARAQSDEETELEPEDTNAPEPTAEEPELEAAPEPETSAQSVAVSDDVGDTPPEPPKKRKHKRGKKDRAQANEETERTPEPEDTGATELKYTETPFEGGSQIKFI